MLRAILASLLAVAIGCGGDGGARDPHERIACTLPSAAGLTCERACDGLATVEGTCTAIILGMATSCTPRTFDEIMGCCEVDNENVYAFFECQ